jgi:NADH-quinone oxidoreductase subunit L
MVFSYLPAIILLAPVTAGLIIGLFSRRFGPKVCHIGVAAEVIAFIGALAVLYDVTTTAPRTIHLSPSGQGLWQISLHLDRLAAVMLVHIAAISVLIHLFSLRYMQQERGYARFHSLLAFTTFVLFGMVSSANLLLLFVFWQLLSWLVPLLSFNYEHAPTLRGAFRTFIIQRAGDIAFLGGIFLAARVYGSLELAEVFARATAVSSTLILWPGGMEIHANTLVSMLIFISAMSKSAQFPFHMWLPDSLYAPTPVTAFLHAGIINAGGFLLARLAPLFAVSPVTLHWVFAVGMLTALLGSSMMLVQNDIKKTLGYSTIGQMGFMIMECGLGAYGLAIFHLIAHGLFKGSIFLNCGYVIHAARQEPRRPSRDKTVDTGQFSTLTWFTGFTTTLILPLVIVLAAHGILNIPLTDSQGAAIFLFFGWATSAQAILTLYRLRAVASWKVAVIMLAVLFVVVLTYLLAAENFSHFIYPAPGEVAYHLRAGALPGPLFDLLVTGFALVIVAGWILIYTASHGRAISVPAWADKLQVALYLLLTNRLYLDTIATKLQTRCIKLLDRLTRIRSFPYIVGLLAVALTLVNTMPSLTMTPRQLVQLIAVTLMLPLFPMHGLYVSALSRLSGYLAAALAVLLPAAGSFGLADLAKEFPGDILQIMNLLAMVGALYGSIKALAQVRMPDLLAYASLAYFSVAWWYFTASGNFTVAVFVYVMTVALLTAAQIIAWQLLRKRFGNLALNRSHGLARLMPRFATLFALCVMAAVGLPPLALFSVPLEMSTLTSHALPSGLIIALLTWFVGSWYSFSMMQRLLFGQHRAEIHYRDLRTSEVVCLVLLLTVSALLIVTPSAWFDAELFNPGQRAAMELSLWPR